MKPNRRDFEERATCTPLLLGFAIMVFLFSFPTGMLFAQPVVKMYDELVELYPDTVFHQGSDTLMVDAARGSYAGVHLLLTGLNLGAIIHSKVLQSGRAVREASWYRMIDVPVEENTGLDSRTEKFSGQKNPYVIRKAPFRIFEALDPITSLMKVDKATIALRLEIPLKRNSAAGKREYTIMLEIGTGKYPMDLVVNVHKAIVPAPKQSAISYVNWHSLGNICADHNVTLWSEPFWRMLGKYAKLMARGRQNAFRVLWNEFIECDSTGKVTAFHRKRLERYVKVFMDAGLRTIQGGPFAGRENWSTDAMYVVPQQYRIPATSERGRKLIVAMAAKLYPTMKANHWLNRWVQGVFDEPTDEYADRYKQVVELFRECMPGIRIIEATMTDKLPGYIDILCPQVQEYQKNREFYDKRKGAGDRVWVYTCLVPGGPWLNRLLDQERLRQVWFGWACAKYGLDGYLHWGFNFHRGGQNPFDQSVIRHSDGRENSFLPAGDTHIIYSKKTGPISGQRFEAIRIGMEDHELLKQLEASDSAKAAAIINSVVRAFDDYSKNVSEYRQAKRSLLESLDEARGKRQRK